MKIGRILFGLLVAAFAMATLGQVALAFCPMCKTAIEGAGAAPEFAGSLNLAALVLLAPPVMIFVALFGLFYRLRNVSGQKAAFDDADEKPRTLTD